MIHAKFSDIVGFIYIYTYIYENISTVSIVSKQVVNNVRETLEFSSQLHMSQKRVNSTKKTHPPASIRAFKGEIEMYITKNAGFVKSKSFSLCSPKSEFFDTF